jgi:hypothetical protein
MESRRVKRIEHSALHVYITSALYVRKHRLKKNWYILEKISSSVILEVLRLIIYGFLQNRRQCEGSLFTGWQGEDEGKFKHTNEEGATRGRYSRGRKTPAPITS